MSENMITAPGTYVIITSAWIDGTERFGMLTAIDGVKIYCETKYAKAAQFMLADIQEPTECGKIRGHVLAGLTETAGLWTIVES